MTMYALIDNAQNFATTQPTKFKKVLIAASALAISLVVLVGAGGSRTTLDMEDIRSLKSAYGTPAASMMVGTYLRAAVHCELDQDSDLSNGDKVVVGFEVNNDICKDLGIKIKADKLTFRVKDLT